MRTEPRPSSFSHRLDVLYLSPPVSTWRSPGYPSFVYYPGRAKLRYGLAVALPTLALMVWIFLGPQKLWGAVPVVAGIGLVAWMTVLQVGSTGGKLANPDLAALALSAAKATGMSTSSEAWRVAGPPAGRLASELQRLSAGLAELPAVPNVPREQIERDWLAEQVSPEFAGYLPNAALKSSGVEPDAVEIEPFTAGEPWPTLENRNREWPRLGDTDESPRTL
ncbi:hypothetical protein ATK74_2963 [Propionicimonas paludicola]|uniref:Uncharacterized protein n=1 Tax=Propionicimonas paludicola TaxID=185243 RepID=A0A2A9CVE8_9ACTN|nr:hypothetical protein [Propionicimonas paludicola]PFG18378.1 hypothetical protein ATK74_2963 [Propionicimonas paludicola]